jgi:hypothetical protein
MNEMVNGIGINCKKIRNTIFKKLDCKNKPIETTNILNLLNLICPPLQVIQNYWFSFATR